MLRKLAFNATNICGWKIMSRGSALFINGSKATETFTYVVPHIEFPAELDVVQQQLQQRNCTDVSLDKVVNLWDIYTVLKTQKSELDKKKDELAKRIGELLKNSPKDEDIEKYKKQIGLVKDNIRKLKETLWSAEENAVLELLKLPASLHPRTLSSGNEILYSHASPPKTNKDHMTIGKQNNLLELKNTEMCYLKGDAAIFELKAKFYFSNLLRKAGFVQFSNPDFVKSVIVEGCGSDHTNPDSTFILHHNEDSKVNPNNRLHLIGGGSIMSFFAYLTKCIIPVKTFPLKYYSLGQQYLPTQPGEDNLFNVSQSATVQFLIASKVTELDEMVDEMFNTIKEAYIELGYHFRIVTLPARDLYRWESFRLSVQMFSTSKQKYVEVANVSGSGDYICKRLLVSYTENQQQNYPYVVSGTILNVPKLLGCILEQDCDFNLSKKKDICALT